MLQVKIGYTSLTASIAFTSLNAEETTIQNMNTNKGHNLCSEYILAVKKSNNAHNNPIYLNSRNNGSIKAYTSF